MSLRTALPGTERKPDHVSRRLKRAPPAARGGNELLEETGTHSVPHRAVTGSAGGHRLRLPGLEMQNTGVRGDVMGEVWVQSPFCFIDYTTIPKSHI